MMMVHEILEQAAKATKKQEKIAILQNNNCLALRDILRGGMDPTLTFLLPAGAPPYVTQSERGITNQTRKFGYWIKGGPGERMLPAKREKMFIDILESVHPKEAELIIRMKDKALITPTGSAYYKGITKKLVNEAFPNLLKG